MSFESPSSLTMIHAKEALDVTTNDLLVLYMFYMSKG